jgi:hypothetical protein
MLAYGRSVVSVINELKKRGMTSTEIEESWPDVRNRGIELVRIRRRRVRTMGLIWLSLGITILGGIVWCVIMNDKFPFALLLGVIPLTYGIYLLRLSPTQEPSIEPPRLFGRDL